MRLTIYTFSNITRNKKYYDRTIFIVMNSSVKKTRDLTSSEHLFVRIPYSETKKLLLFSCLACVLAGFANVAFLCGGV